MERTKWLLFAFALGLAVLASSPVFAGGDGSGGPQGSGGKARGGDGTGPKLEKRGTVTMGVEKSGGDSIGPKVAGHSAHIG